MFIFISVLHVTLFEISIEEKTSEKCLFIRKNVIPLTNKCSSLNFSNPSKIYKKFHIEQWNLRLIEYTNRFPNHVSHRQIYCCYWTSDYFITTILTPHIKHEIWIRFLYKCLRKKNNLIMNKNSARKTKF